jgi:hypothetical protein
MFVAVNLPPGRNCIPGRVADLFSFTEAASKVKVLVPD